MAAVSKSVPLVIALLAATATAKRACGIGYTQKEFLKCELDCTTPLRQQYMCDGHLDYYLSPVHSERFPVKVTDAGRCDPAWIEANLHTMVNGVCYKMCQAGYEFKAPDRCEFVCNKQWEQAGRCEDADRLDYRVSLAALGVAQVVPLKSNIAQGKPARQSSLYNQAWAATNAVDGKTEGDVNKGSCVHTGEEAEPWWETDLGAMHRVSTVRVWARSDDNSERLDGFRVTIDGVICGDDYNTAPPPGGYTDVKCDVSGKRVKVQSTRFSSLNLCEVEVEGVPVSEPVPKNSACGKPSTQSSVNFEGTAEKANDCNTNGIYWVDPLNLQTRRPQSCSHTKVEDNPWWEVDLQAKTFVTGVRIWNRRDCCSDKLDGFEVRVDNQICGKVGNTAPPAGTAREVKCGLTGQKVRVVLPRKGYLSLCEVEVLTMDSDHQATIKGSLTAGKDIVDAIAIANATITLASTAGQSITVTTNTKGEFQAKVPPGTYALSASTPNTVIPVNPANGKTTVTVAMDETKDVPFLYASVTGQVTGRVLKFTKKRGQVVSEPIPGTVIRFLTKNGTHLATTTTTSDDGSFTANIPVDNYVVAPIVAPGMQAIGKADPIVPVNVTAGSVTGNVQFNLTIAPGQPGTITGVVFADLEGSGDADNGRGVQRATVQIQNVDDTEQEPINITTNKFGEFRAQVPPGEYTVTVETPNKQTFLNGNSSRSVVVEAGKNVDLEFAVKALNREVQLWGTVFKDNSNNGRLNQGEDALEGVPVSLYSSSNPARPLESVLTDENGDFHFAHAKHGETYKIVVTPPEGVVVRTTTNVDSQGAITVAVPTTGPPTMLQVALIDAPKKTAFTPDARISVASVNQLAAGEKVGAQCEFCDKNAECVNNQCVCKAGFVGSGIICTAQGDAAGGKPSQQRVDEFVERFKNLDLGKWGDDDDE